MEPFTTLDQFCVWPETNTIVHTPSNNKWTLSASEGAVVEGPLTEYGLRSTCNQLALAWYDNSIPVLRLRLDGSMTITSAQLVQFIFDVLCIEDDLITRKCQVGHITCITSTCGVADTMSTNMQQVLELDQHPLSHASRLGDAIINIMGCDRTPTRPERDNPTDPLLFRFFVPNNPERYPIACMLVRNSNNKDPKVYPGSGAFIPQPPPQQLQAAAAPPPQSSPLLPKTGRPLKRQRTKYNSNACDNNDSGTNASGETAGVTAAAVTGRRGRSRSTRGRGGRRGAHLGGNATSTTTTTTNTDVTAAAAAAAAGETVVAVVPMDSCSSDAAIVDLN